MPKILLLYDTQEDDLARDFRELLSELGCEAVMMSRSPNRGKTLHEKEDGYLKGAAGAIFLLTPGAERDGLRYPSPSVTDEMGRIGQMFESNPERVIYLRDSNCSLQAIDQRSYINFDRQSMRSVLKALTDLVRDMNAAGFLGRQQPAAAKPAPAPRIDLGDLSRRIARRLMKMCVRLSEAQGGMMMHKEFVLHLAGLGFSKTEINFAKRDLTQLGLVKVYPSTGVYLEYATVTLTDLGFELVRYELSDPRPGVLR